MPGQLSTPINEKKKTGILMRLHRDGRGLASIEFILSAPVILLIVIAVRQANLLSVRRIDTMREVRSAAFAEASGLTCTSDFSQTIPIPIPQIASALPAGQGPERTTCSSQPSNGGGGDPSRTFVWDDVNKKAKSVSDNLAGDLANEKPTLVTATATRVYRYSTNPLTKPFRWTDRFTVDDSTLFASTNDTTRRGYDPTLRKSIRNVASGAGDLFDGIFPGAK